MALGAAVAAPCANKALLIGIGDYDTDVTGWARISGTNDVTLIGDRLAARGFDIATITDADATKAGITAGLETLTASAAPGDTIYIQFSGHGQLFEDMNGDEEEGVDQSFACYDAPLSPQFEVDGQPYYGQNHLIDDELYAYFNTIKSAVGTDGMVMVVFDSCYSGGAERDLGSGKQSETSPVEWVNTTRGSDDFVLTPQAEAYLGNLQTPGDYSPGGSLTVISACEYDSKNFECRDKQSGVAYGSLSYCLATMLDRGMPISDFGKYFADRTFRELQIFRINQRPVVVTLE